MPIPLVDLKAQYHSIQSDIDVAITRVMENTSFILGKEVELFEQAFARYCGVEYAVGLSSGTDALVLALLACGVGPGDEVITTTMTFIATAAAISHTGARPVLVDIDPVSRNIDPARIEKAITPRTKAIMPVHLYGQVADMDAINAIAHERGLRVIEDACQAHGATYKGRRAGGLADGACFSFYPAKNLGGAGDGGAFTTDDTDLAARVRNLRDHGRTSKYSHSAIGYTYRLDALQAAILAVKLPHLDDWNQARRDKSSRYNALLADSGAKLPVEAPDCHSSYHIYGIEVDRRDALLQHLQSRGIGAGIHYPLPVHLQPAYADLGLPAGSFPSAERVAEREISLPLYPEMTDAQMDEVIGAFNEFYA
mgnify:CR=1 FL=1